MAGATKRVSHKSATPLIVAIVIAVLIVAIAYYVHAYKPHEAFTSPGSDDLHLVMFKADWCPHCQHALPRYKELMSALSGYSYGSRKLYFDIVDPELDRDSVVVASADDGMEVKLKYPYARAQPALIKGFPTYMLYGVAGGPMRYTGPLERDSILAFVGTV